MVEIFQDGNKIGSYNRNYSSMYNTFVPFTKDGKDYALYSDRYTATSVMSLPDCKKIAGEEPNSFGFCPVDFYVPDWEGYDGSFGFVAGCVWGDDSTWKVQLLDLRHVEEGILKRINFAYHELPSKSILLKDAVDKYEYDIYIDEDTGELALSFRIATSSMEYTVKVPGSTQQLETQQT